jgi:hypothetical protein
MLGMIKPYLHELDLVFFPMRSKFQLKKKPYKVLLCVTTNAAGETADWHKQTMHMCQSPHTIRT